MDFSWEFFKEIDHGQRGEGGFASPIPDSSPSPVLGLGDGIRDDHPKRHRNSRHDRYLRKRLGHGMANCGILGRLAPDHAPQRDDRLGSLDGCDVRRSDRQLKRSRDPARPDVGLRDPMASERLSCPIDESLRDRFVEPRGNQDKFRCTKFINVR